ncbi:MAG: ABC transporter permease [Prolixibacteraceae bacterium]|jgi:lipopolysaccharide transport system permease protein|nr:ABC transporter permease [Prolixibacteraceae bacterium]
MQTGNSTRYLVIEPRTSLFNLNLKEIWQYRDLLEMYIKRDIVTSYKQTVLGPIWFFIQPIFTTIVFMFVFGGLAGIPTDGIPQALFYLSGITLWNYFSESLTKTSDTFLSNQAIFGKVYFPRLIVPLSITITGLIKMLIQFAVFIIVYIYFMASGRPIAPNAFALLLPVLIIIMAALSLGFGIIISSMTTKYRDLRFLITFAIQLWMYATPVIYPLSVMEGNYKKYIWLIQANPLTAVLETFKYGFLGHGSFSWYALGYSLLFSVITLFIGMAIFNKVERSFMDVI